MNASLTAEERRLYRPIRCQLVFLAGVIIVLGIAAWQSNAKYQIIYRDLGIEGTVYNTVFRTLGTPATLAVAIVVAVAAVIASRRLSLAALGWLCFAITVGAIIFFAACVALFFMAISYPTVSITR